MRVVLVGLAGVFGAVLGGCVVPIEVGEGTGSSSGDPGSSSSVAASSGEGSSFGGSSSGGSTSGGASLGSSMAMGSSTAAASSSGGVVSSGAGASSGGGGSSSAGATLCTDTCFLQNDGVCEDGGPGSDFPVCNLGTDCTDCGPRVPGANSSSGGASSSAVAPSSGGSTASSSSGGGGMSSSTTSASGGACQGTWTSIPPLLLNNEPPAFAGVTARADGHVFVLYGRPADVPTPFGQPPPRIDVAEYVPGTGWLTFESVTEVRMRGVMEFAATSTGLVVWYESGTVSGALVRGEYDLATHAWTNTSPFGANPPADAVYYRFARRMLTDNWMTYFGELYDDGQTPTCRLTRPSILVLPFTSNPQQAVQPGIPPLSSRVDTPAARVGDRVFFWGGYRQFRGNGCQKTYHQDGAFFQPSTGAWSSPVTIPAPDAPIGQANSEVIVVDLGDRAGVVEKIGSQTRVHTLTPGATAYQTFSPPQAYNEGQFVVEFWNRENSQSSGTFGIVMFSPSRHAGWRYQTSTNAMAPLCTPPGPISGLEYFAGSLIMKTAVVPTDLGLMVLGREGGGYLTLP